MSEFMDLLNFTLDSDEDSYCMSVTCELSSSAAWALSTVGSPLNLTLNGVKHKFLIDSRSRTREFGSTVYNVEARSVTIVLGAGSNLVYKDWEETTAESVISELCTASGITVDFQIADWLLPTGVMSSNGETPIEIINRLAKAAGAILQTDPDGTLVVMYRYEKSPALYNIGDYDLFLSDNGDILAITETTEIAPKYDAIMVTNGGTVSSGVDTLEIVPTAEDDNSVLLRVVKFPFVSSVELFHSYDASVDIVPDAGNPIDEVIVEVVEIIAGAGSTSMPIKDIVSMAYKKSNLGEVSFEGTVVSTGIVGQSLIEITYTTSYHLFNTSCSVQDKVQFFIN